MTFTHNVDRANRKVTLDFAPQNSGAQISKKAQRTIMYFFRGKFDKQLKWINWVSDSRLELNLRKRAPESDLAVIAKFVTDWKKQTITARPK